VYNRDTGYWGVCGLAATLCPADGGASRDWIHNKPVFNQPQGKNCGYPAVNRLSGSHEVNRKNQNPANGGVLVFLKKI